MGFEGDCDFYVGEALEGSGWSIFEGPTRILRETTKTSLVNLAEVPASHGCYRWKIVFGVSLQWKISAVLWDTTTVKTALVAHKESRGGL